MNTKTLFGDHNFARSLHFCLPVIAAGGNIREVVGVKAALVEVKKEIAIASTKLLNAASVFYICLCFQYVCMVGGKIILKI